ncbi:hypothetical protein IWX90DRAFT_393060 [Phyllosticta citrichinensis]|uniref:PHD-type domain-containing protein n=1 Tax=Phyllosticta citrichinensis TaxID=1130410 RepID=A0ABR1XGW4_9PEZI
MSFKLSSLLNPASEPNSPKGTNSKSSQLPPVQDVPTHEASEPQREIFQDDQSNRPTSAWAGYARSDSPKDSFSNERASPSATRNDQYGKLPPYPQARRTSSYGSPTGPVEPYSFEAPQMPVRSPSLEQYHHRARSPEEQRRLSYMSMSSNPPVLPPIQSFGDVLERRPSDQGQSIPQPQFESAFAYGKDASQVIAPPSTTVHTADEPQSPNSIAQNREPDFVRNEPVTAQIRGSSPPPSPDTTSTPVSSHSTPQVKLEPTAPSREPTPVQAQAMPKTAGEQVETPSLDTDTLKALAEATNEHGLRNVSREAKPAVAAPVPSAPAMSDTSNSPTAPRKRKPVDSKVKKGGPKKPSQGKKRKVDDSGEGQPSRTPSTKASVPRSRGKKSSDGTPMTGSSPAPVPSSPATHAEDAEDDESGSDDGIYCICRKGDNHTWMIACDGSCEDWYHGKCVDVREADGDLIEQYFCPSCTAAGEGRTTWKRMCRRPGCRRPARRNQQSKYCCDECGILFMQETFGHLPGGEIRVGQRDKRRRDRRRTNLTDNTGNETEASEEDGLSGPRGSVMSVRDLKAMAAAARDVEHFKSLGNSLLSPPATASPSSPDFERDLKDDAALSPPDAARIAAIQSEVADLKKRFELLKERERFVAMTKEQATHFAEKEGVKVKDICAYDPRLAWSEAEFALWRDSAKGQACFAQGTLNAEPTSADGDVEVTDGGDVAHVNGTAPLCPRKRCTRHTQWAKIAHWDVQFELALCRQQMGELSAEEREIRERAVVGWRKESKRAASAAAAAVPGHDAATLVNGTGVKEVRAPDKEGWVEVLG